MEGVGSRLGRGFRYGTGPAPSAPVLNGPVRKWKSKWVRSQSTENAGSGKGNQQQQETSLLLSRWTPLTSSNSGDSSEPSKRKFRYTPGVEMRGICSGLLGTEVIVLEEKKKEAVKKINEEAEAWMNFEEP